MKNNLFYRSNSKWIMIVSFSNMQINREKVWGVQLAWKFAESKNFSVPVSYRKDLCREDKIKALRCHKPMDKPQLVSFFLLLLSWSFTFFFLCFRVDSAPSASMRCLTQPSSKCLKFGTNNDLRWNININFLVLSEIFQQISITLRVWLH